jgi:hypothetical protein
MHDTFLHALDLFARGGGGGSGGGGSGGGGEIIALIGYFPSYYLGKLVKKLLPRKAELIVSASFASLFSILIFAVGIFGGFLGGYVAILVIIGIWAGWAAAFFGVWDRLKQRSQKAKQAIQLAGQMTVRGTSKRYLISRNGHSYSSKPTGRASTSQIWLRT